MLLTEAYLTLSQLSILIPVFAGARHYKLLNRPFKILFYFFVISILFEILGEITRRVYHNNMPGQHVFTLVEFLAFSTVFYLHTRNKLVRYLVLINTFVFIGIAIVTVLNVKGILKPNDLPRGYSSAFMTVYVLVYLYYLFQKDDIRYMWEYPMFWICTGALLYFAVNFIYIIARSEFVKYPDWEWGAHLLHAGLNIIANCLYAQSFQCLKKQKTVS